MQIQEINELRKIRKYAIIALFSDDELLEKLVLKGGNALDIIYNVSQRPSIDIDLSIEDDIDQDNINIFREKIENALKKYFSEQGYIVFDIKLKIKPEKRPVTLPPFWGGYEITFKLTTKEKYEKYSEDDRLLRITAISLGKNNRKSFRIDISKYEYCKAKIEYELEYYTIFVYSPEMLLIEKIRSICQQMPEYTKIIGKNYLTPRARDFYDIFMINQNFHIDLTTKDNLKIIKAIFAAKKVPLDLIGKIKNYRDYHERDYLSLIETLPNKEKINTFDFYFDYVVNLCGSLKSLWNK